MQEIPSFFIGSYQIVAKIGSGGMGEIFLAIHHGAVKTYVALKQMHVHLLKDRKFRRLFLREASILAQLQPASHPNLIQIFDVGEENGQGYIVMEYVPGYTLNTLCQSARDLNPFPTATLIPIEHCIEIAIYVCAGLEYLHTIIVAHRDLTPANVLISQHGSVKILDFGIAKIEANTKSFKGTLAYMSPEQVDHQKIDHRSDFYSLGMILYKLLTGKRPPRFESQLPFDPRIPEELTLILKKMLEVQPENRYGSARELREALEQFKIQWHFKHYDFGNPFRLADYIKALKLPNRIPKPVYDVMNLEKPKISGIKTQAKALEEAQSIILLNEDMLASPLLSEQITLESPSSSPPSPVQETPSSLHLCQNLNR